MVAFPNAKINIGLNITDRRPDGYHNLESIFYPVSVRDVVEVIEAPYLQFTASGLDIPGSLADNLCMKAFTLIAKDYDLSPVHIHLHKHIPIGAGLGGGSADAAFFIRLLSDKFNLGLTDEQMEGYSRTLGADCAFFIRNKPVFACGRGDEFKSVDLDLSNYFVVLVMPDVQISTSEAYRGVKPTKPQTSLSELIHLPVAEWKNQIKNDFEPTIFKNHPSIRGVKAGLYEAGALYASMSGSGSSVYGIFKEKMELPVLEKSIQIFYDVQL
ncbi:MAG TPA: 4-(cytidine 5'-diphospho)-2-C-methyl-D-erythritol kinase [Sphingobacteriaceae bacterium]|nr:4-(cytidine 5'-diphospho)-2-C-methyl-D-erythritol kinase [Sphingobacteriaceae bacterium]